MQVGTGKSILNGIAIGKLKLYKKKNTAISAAEVADTAAEIERFEDARAKAIEMTIDAGHRHNIWVGICGELGADTALTETFLRMGVDELSMNAKSILPVRKIVRSLDLSKPSAKQV